MMEETVAESASVGEAVAVAAPEAVQEFAAVAEETVAEPILESANIEASPVDTLEAVQESAIASEETVAEPTVDSAITEPAAVATPEPVQGFVAVADEIVAEPTPTIEPEIEQSAVTERCFRSRFRSSAGIRCS